MWLQQVVFYIASILLIISALFTVLSNNPVQSVLSLVGAFVASAVLWLLLESEFLALILIVVYVGAVMTLFLFVVMMMDLDKAPKQQGFVKYLPIGAAVIAVLVGLMGVTLWHQPIGALNLISTANSNFNSVQALGEVLYTQYLLPFEIAGILLLVAMIAAISLAFRGRRANTRAQRVHDQVSVRRGDRVRLVDMPASKPGSPS